MKYVRSLVLFVTLVVSHVALGMEVVSAPVIMGVKAQQACAEEMRFVDEELHDLAIYKTKHMHQKEAKKFMERWVNMMNFLGYKQEFIKAIITLFQMAEHAWQSDPVEVQAWIEKKD